MLSPFELLSPKNKQPQKTKGFTNTTTGSVVSRSTDLRLTEPSSQDEEKPPKDPPRKRGRFLTTEKQYLNTLLDCGNRYQRPHDLRQPNRRYSYHPYRDPGPLPLPKKKKESSSPFCPWDDQKQEQTTPPRGPLGLEETEFLRNIPPMNQIFNFSERRMSFFDLEDPPSPPPLYVENEDNFLWKVAPPPLELLNSPGDNQPVRQGLSTSGSG